MRAAAALKRAAWLLVVTAALTAGLYLARGLPPVGADGPYMARLIERETVPMYYRSLLTLWIHRACYAALSPLGWDGERAMAFSSALAGAFALQALWALRPRAAFIAINVLCGSFLVFVGHIENYAWVNAFLIASYLYLQRWFEGRAPLWPAMTFFFLAALSHMLALFYAPAFVYALRKNPRFNPLEALIPLLAFISIVVTLSLCCTMQGTEIGLERLVPLLERWKAKNHWFTFFSWEHLKMLAWFHQRAAFLGVPIELPLLWMLRRRVQTPFQKFLVINVFCGLAWTTIWHPDWGAMDWDLFSQFAIPLHVLLGLLIVKPAGNNETSA
ncbi:MAG: hypothetical protein GC154_03000 [bacterium]|nr:hypothetical protein [bacterium]